MMAERSPGDDIKRSPFTCTVDTSGSSSNQANGIFEKQDQFVSKKVLKDATATSSNPVDDVMTGQR